MTQAMNRISMLVGALLTLGAANVSAEMSGKIVAPYLHIQQTLAADSTEGVAEAAKAIATEASSIGEDGAAISAAARAVAAAAGDLKTARAAFGPLSNAVISYAKDAGMGELKLAFCPMARKSWIQENGPIANPYYGSEMLTCGSFQ